MLAGGALANNVYWQVLGAVSFGAGAKAVGTFLGAGAICFGEGASLKGRALTPTTVGLANSPFAISKDDLTAPVVTIDGGAARATNDLTPSISGTTDEPAGGQVSVTVADQTLTHHRRCRRGLERRCRHPGRGSVRRGRVDLGRVPERRHRDPGPDRRRDRAR